MPQTPEAEQYRQLVMDAIAEGAEHYEIDAEKCCECGACTAGCPVEAIVEE